MSEARRIRSVLVLDDDEMTLAAFRRALGSGREIWTASDPDDACELARQKQPDLAIIDLKLGQRCGIDFIPEIKAAHPKTYVAVVSGYASVENTQNAVKAGADLVLAKPVAAQEILRRVEGGKPQESGWKFRSLARVEGEHAHNAVRECDGNISEAARRLGMHRYSLQRILKRPLPP